tara:strand:+ start:108 stop:662 length:555 start_codon:yes stop_codon:yes gene_type:complete
MKKIIISLITLITSTAYANQINQFYQVDVIVFAQDKKYKATSEHELSPLLITEYPKAIPLKPIAGDNDSFELLPASKSKLNQELWALHHKSSYKVLAHYSWMQPDNNRQPVIIPKVNVSGWDLEGTFRIQHTNYYQLETELLFSTPEKQSAPFVFSQKHRLEQNKVYYLDHPEAGILIKIHPTA